MSNQNKSKFEYPKVIIFYAMDSERDKIIKPAIIKLGFVGKYIWLSNIGVGKVSATLNAGILLSRFLGAKKTHCINVGVCGGSPTAAKDYPCVEIDRVYNNDHDTSAVDGLPFDKQFIDLHTFGLEPMYCFTQDRFMTNPREVQTSVGKIAPKDIPWYVDMELFGVAAVCKELGFDLTAIKSVSDVVGTKKQKEQYAGDGFDKACERAIDLLAQTLEKCLNL